MTDLPPTTTQASPEDASDSNNTLEILAADELKDQGNDCFRSSQWTEALVAYQSALSHLPQRRTTISQPKHDDPPDSFSASVKDEGCVTPATNESSSSQEIPDTIAKRRAVLNANIGACHVKLKEHKEAVNACSQGMLAVLFLYNIKNAVPALLDDPQYVKALQRRASSNEALNSWSSLTAAQEDYNLLLRLLSPSSTQYRDIERALLLLKPRLERAQKQETTEMLDKLKGLGNSILGTLHISYT
ncbi:hypothetical protein H0H93_008113 [Arthromyces matolae]|nr:hypothetical protein H0H93_008113 [Arthromyces matolae]